MKLIYSYTRALHACIATQLYHLNTFILSCYSSAAHRRTRMFLVSGFLPVAYFCFTAIALAQPSGSAGTGGTVVEITPLRVGQKVPEEFWTREHLFYVNGDTVRRSLEEHKGKLLLLDFWATWCGPCLRGFGKLETISKVYADYCAVLLVNTISTRDNYDRIHHTYLDTKNKWWNASLPTIMADDYLETLFPHKGVPYIVWISNKGTVHSLTRDSFVSGGAIFQLIDERL